MKKSRKPPPDFACLGGSHDRSKSVAPVARWDITLYNRTLHFSRLRSISAFNTHSLFLPRPPLPPLEKLRNRSLVRKQVPIKTSTTKKKKKYMPYKQLHMRIFKVNVLRIALKRFEGLYRRFQQFRQVRRSGAGQNSYLWDD